MAWSAEDTLILFAEVPCTKWFRNCFLPAACFIFQLQLTSSQWHKTLKLWHTRKDLYITTSYSQSCLSGIKHVIPSSTHSKHSYYTETSLCPFIQIHHLCPHCSSCQPMCVCVWFLIMCVFTERVKWGRMGLFISRKALNHHVIYGSGKRKCSHLEENLGPLKRMTSSCWHN